MRALLSVAFLAAGVLLSAGMPSDNGCASIISNLSLDIVIVIDTSVGMGEEGLTQVLASISTVFGPVTVAQGEGEHSRVGVVTYAANALKKYKLTDFHSTAEMLKKIWEVGCGTDTSANMHDALVKANEVLKEGRTNGERASVKTAIVIYASDYRTDTASDGLEMAKELKGNGTSIIAVGFDQGGKLHVLDKLDKIASNGFFFTNNGADVVTQIQQALCTISSAQSPDTKT